MKTTFTRMKTTNALAISALLLAGLMAGCQKEVAPIVPSANTSAVKSYALPSSTNAVAMSNVDVSLQGKLAGVNLRVAGNFEILSESGITDVYKSSITGDVGSSPITGAAILVTCTEVVGTIYSVDAAGPLPCAITNATMLTTAVSDMETAYNDAAGRINPDFSELGAGDIGGETLTPGLYSWSSSLIIPTDIAISGKPTDVWIFQVAGTLNMSSAVRITLSGGAQAKNIYWVAAGAVTLGTTSHFEGSILGKTGINMQTGASINGRMLAQTAVTLQMNTANMPQ